LAKLVEKKRPRGVGNKKKKKKNNKPKPNLPGRWEKREKLMSWHGKDQGVYAPNKRSGEKSWTWQITNKRRRTVPCFKLTSTREKGEMSKNPEPRNLQEGKTEGGKKGEKAKCPFPKEDSEKMVPRSEGEKGGKVRNGPVTHKNKTGA